MRMAVSRYSLVLHVLVIATAAVRSSCASSSSSSYASSWVLPFTAAAEAEKDGREDMIRQLLPAEEGGTEREAKDDLITSHHPASSDGVGGVRRRRYLMWWNWVGEFF